MLYIQKFENPEATFKYVVINLMMPINWKIILSKKPNKDKNKKKSTLTEKIFHLGKHFISHFYLICLFRFLEARSWYKNLASWEITHCLESKLACRLQFWFLSFPGAEIIRHTTMPSFGLRVEDSKDPLQLWNLQWGCNTFHELTVPVRVPSTHIFMENDYPVAVKGSVSLSIP